MMVQHLGTTWNEYKSKIQTVATGVGVANSDIKTILLDSSYQGVSRLIVAGYPNNGQVRFGDPAAQADVYIKYFTPSTEIENYDLLIDGRHFYDSITMYNQLLKQITGRSGDYTTGSLTDYDYYLKIFNIVVIYTSQQSVLDSDPKSIQQIELLYKLADNSNVQILTVLKKEKETILEFNSGTVKVH